MLICDSVTDAIAMLSKVAVDQFFIKHYTSKHQRIVSISLFVCLFCECSIILPIMKTLLLRIMGNVGQPYSLHFLGHKLPSIKACGSPSPCLTILFGILEGPISIGQAGLMFSIGQHIFIFYFII